MHNIKHRTSNLKILYLKELTGYLMESIYKIYIVGYKKIALSPFYKQKKKHREEIQKTFFFGRGGYGFIVGAEKYLRFKGKL